MNRFAIALCAFLACSITNATEQWNVWGGSAIFSFKPGQLERMGLEFEGRSLDHVDPTYRSSKAIGGLAGNFKINAEDGSFAGYHSGHLSFAGGPKLAGASTVIDLSSVTIRPVAHDSLELDVFDANGNHVFRSTHTHLLMDVQTGSLALRNMDLEVTEWLAKAVGHKDAAGFVPGVMDIEVVVDVSEVDRTRGACTSQNWPTDPGFDADVALADISTVQVADNTPFGGLIGATPSATLENVGTADVPWYSKFSAPAPPYNNDQHPFLVWTMYRINTGGRLDQLGFSEIKHAFFSINSGCPCNGGTTLWVGCGDTYGVSTNDNRGNLGFRQFIEPDTGVWQRCGSAWDDSPVPGVGVCAGQVAGDGVADAPPVGDQFDRIMTMHEADVQDATAQYLFEAWYLVRDDINIFNTMGFRGVDPSQSFVWSSGAGLEPFTVGPVFDYWADNATGNVVNTLVSTKGASMKLGVNVVQEGEMFRYNYSLMAYDFDQEVSSVAIPTGDGAMISAYEFKAPYGAQTADWTVDGPGKGQMLEFAPTAPEDNLKWGRMVSFSFLSEGIPQASTATITAGDGITTHSAATLAPTGLSDLIFDNTFD